MSNCQIEFSQFQPNFKCTKVKSTMSNVNNVKCRQCQMSTMLNVNNVKLSTMSNCQQCRIVNNVKLSTMWNCQQFEIFNNVKLSTMWNCQQCEIVNHVKLSTMWRMSNCPNIKLSKCQIVNQIVKLSQYQMSCIIRVCRLT